MVTHLWHAFVLLKLSSFRDSQNEDAYPHPNTNVKYWYTSFAKHHNERDREKETAGLAIDRVYARLLFICQITKRRLQFEIKACSGSILYPVPEGVSPTVSLWQRSVTVMERKKSRTFKTLRKHSTTTSRPNAFFVSVSEGKPDAGESRKTWV